MRIKKFLESTSYESIIDSYLSDLSDDMKEKNIDLKINKKSDEFFEVVINLKNYYRTSLSEEAISSVNRFQGYLNHIVEITKYVRSSILGLMQEDEIEKIKFEPDIENNLIKLTIIAKSENNEDWFIVGEYHQPYINEVKLKNKLKEEFNVDLHSLEIETNYDEFDNETTHYLFITILGEKNESVKDYILSYKYGNEEIFEYEYSYGRNLSSGQKNAGYKFSFKL